MKNKNNNIISTINISTMQKGDLTANLELGQIIQLIAPKNDDINNKIFLIDYLDKNFIKLVDQELNYLDYKIIEKDGKK